MDDESLDTEVKRLLEDRRGDWHLIAADPSADVSYSWLSKFANGRIENPGYATLKRLRDYLKAHSAAPLVKPEAA